MSEEEKKAFKVINTRTRRLLDELEIEKEDMSDEPKIAYLMQEIRANKIILNLIEKLQKENEELSRENRKLRTIRYDTAYGVESIYLITKRDLVEINTNKYFIEIQDGKFVDLKQVYQENEKLNEYKENYIPVQKVKDKIEELNNISNAEELEDTMIGENYTIAELVQYVLQELIKEREENNNGKNI